MAIQIYPREFRARFGDELLSDVTTQPTNALSQLLGILNGGIAMRLNGMTRDFSYAIRRLRSAPLFVAVVIFTFALGIGANVAVFSVLKDVVLRPLPFPEPARLVILESTDPSNGKVVPNIPARDIVDIRAQAHSLTSIAAVGSRGATLVINGLAFSVNGLNVSPDYFSMLGLTTQAGRLLNADDAEPGQHNVVISDQLWHRRFNGQQDILGHSIMLDGQQFSVVGILRPDALLASPADESVKATDFLRVPEKGAAEREGYKITDSALARLAPGATIESANADLARVSLQNLSVSIDNQRKPSFSAIGLSGAVLGAAANALWIIFAAVVGILLIACANVGNMLGARWSSRDRELAVRRALGASAQRIASQLFVETGLLALVGALVGVALAYAALRSMASLVSEALPRASNVTIDGFSLFYALIAVVLATIFAGMSPVLSLGKTDLQSALKAAGRGGDSSGGHRMRSGLVIVEIALALALVVVSGLMVRNFAEIVNTPLGIHPQGVVVSEAVAVPAQFSTNTARAALEKQLLTRLRALPGVDSADIAFTYPLSNFNISAETKVFGRTYAARGPVVRWNIVGPDYFHTLGLPVIGGRAFTDSDSMSSSPVVIVNELYAKRFLNGQNPIGSRISILGGPWVTIIAVVDNERQSLTLQPEPEFYTPMSQTPPPSPLISAIAHSSSVHSSALGREIQSTFAELMPLVPSPDTFTLSERIASLTSQTRFATVMLGVLAIIALLLACAGVFGVVSFSVTQRLREFGIRIALGAQSRDILIDVLRRAISTTAIGVAAGLAIAAISAHAITSQLQSISPFDPATFAGVVALIFSSSVLASLHPALRATRSEPVAALRYE